MLEKSVEAIREAEEREGAKTRVRLMESHCEELEDLADKVKKQAVRETEPEPMIELGEEIEYRRDNMVNLAQMLKQDIPNEFKEPAQRALQESAKMAKEGQCKLGDLKARLEFRSFDSEAGSYRGPAPSAGEAVPGSCPFSGNPVGGGARIGAGRSSISTDVMALLRGWGQLRAYDSGWPVFDAATPATPDSRRSGWPTGRHTIPL